MSSDGFKAEAQGQHAIAKAAKAPREIIFPIVSQTRRLCEKSVFQSVYDPRDAVLNQVNIAMRAKPVVRVQILCWVIAFQARKTSSVLLR